jgi:tetratricopeptide (TPR) repeat protein
MSTVKKSGEPLWLRYVSSGWRAYKSGDFAAAEKLLTTKLSELETGAGERQDVQAHVLALLANVYRDCDRFEEADKLYERAAQIKEHAGMSGDAGSMEMLRERTLCFLMQGKFNQAVASETDALRIARFRARFHQFEVHTSLSRLAVIAFVNRDFQLSSKYYGKCLNFRSNSIPQADPSLHPLLADSGVAYFLAGRYVEAEECFEQALDLICKDADEEYSYLHNNLGLALCAQSRMAQAQPLCRRAAGLRSKRGNANSPTGELNEIADTYCNYQRFEDARPLCEQSLIARYFEGFDLTGLLATYIRLIKRLNCCEQTSVLEARLLRLRHSQP